MTSTDRFENLEATELKQLKAKLATIDWGIRYGNVNLQIRDGKPTLVKVERTIRLD